MIVDPLGQLLLALATIDVGQSRQMDDDLGTGAGERGVHAGRIGDVDRHGVGVVAQVACRAIHVEVVLRGGDESRADEAAGADDEKPRRHRHSPDVWPPAAADSALGGIELDGAPPAERMIGLDQVDAPLDRAAIAFDVNEERARRRTPARQPRGSARCNCVKGHSTAYRRRTV